MKTSIVVATHGDNRWRDLAWSHAYPSTLSQSAWEVVVHHDPTGTLADTRNAAAALTRGDWLCFLDADDRLAPGYLDAMAQAAVDGAALLAPAVQYIDGGKPVGEARIPNLGRWPDLNEMVIGTLVPRVLFETVGGFRDLSSLEDYDVWLRCVAAGARIVHVPDAVYVATVSPEGRNSDQSIYPMLRREHHQVWQNRIGIR